MIQKKAYIEPEVLGKNFKTNKNKKNIQDFQNVFSKRGLNKKIIFLIAAIPFLMTIIFITLLFWLAPLWVAIVITIFLFFPLIKSFKQILYFLLKIK